MMRIRIEEPLRSQWLPVVARYFQMMLASSSADIRSLGVSLLEEHGDAASATSYVCELRGRHRDGLEIRVRSTHAEAETAIGHAFARARREIRRRRMSARITD